MNSTFVSGACKLIFESCRSAIPRCSMASFPAIPRCAQACRIWPSANGFQLRTTTLLPGIRRESRSWISFLATANASFFMSALMNRCDAKDGVADGMISDPLGCDFDPAVLSCKGGQSEACIAPEKVAAIKKAFAGPKNLYGTQVYPGFLYDTGIAETGPVPGLLALGTKGLFGPYPTATEIDVDKEALHASDPLVEPASTNLSTFSRDGGKILFFHGDSDPWFSPLDTLHYYQSLAAANGGATKVSEWSRMFLVPGMRHCGGGLALDQFDMLSAVVKWVEKRRCSGVCHCYRKGISWPKPTIVSISQACSVFGRGRDKRRC